MGSRWEFCHTEEVVRWGIHLPKINEGPDESQHAPLLSIPSTQERLVNMNEAGDDHISFSAKHLALSPDGR